MFKCVLAVNCCNDNESFLSIWIFVFSDNELLRRREYLAFVLDNLNNFLCLLQILDNCDCKQLLFLVVVNGLLN
jgi:hypothetical protein